MMRRLVLLLALFSSPAWSASFYISTTGSDTNTCTNQTTDACATFPRCGALMAAGDTCYALSGTYVTSGTDGWTFAITGGTSVAHKKFTSLSQDPSTVTIRAANPTTENTYKLQGNIGGSQSDYLEFSYLTFEGRMSSNSPVDGLTYHHNIFRCPNVGTGGGNSPFIYLSGDNTEMIDDVWVYENLFTMDDTCPANGSASLEWMVWFNVNGAVIEKNDFVNTHTTRNLFAGVYLKRANKDVIIRKNYFRGKTTDGQGAIWLMDCAGTVSENEYGDRSGYGGSARCNNKVYQNVIDGANDSGVYLKGITCRDEWVYNNTFVDVKNRCVGLDIDFGTAAAGDGNSIFNNLCYRSSGNYADAVIAVTHYGTDSVPCVSNQSIVDYNLYYPAGQTFKDCGSYSTSSLATWKSHNSAGSDEQNSIESDPLLTNAASRDYTLQGGSPARSSGRGSGFSSYIGAYITADQTDQIGCSWHPSCYSYNAAEAPSTSGNPRRVDMRGVSFK